MSDINVTVANTAIEVLFPVSIPGSPGVGVPAGGDTGEVLVKVDGTDYNTTWAAQGAASKSRTVLAGENINAGKVAVIDGGVAYRYQPGTAAYAGRTIGITNNAATTGNAVTIQYVGEVTDAGFGIYEDLVVWAAADGELTTTLPTSGTIQKVGFGIGSNTILLDFSIQITLI